MPDARANRLVLWLSAASTVTAESLALESGADGLVVDHQHGGFGMDQALHLVQAVVSKTPLTVVRIAEVGDAETCKFLDAGASTLIAPMINSRAQAERFVQACYYPPSGVRSFGPYRQKLLVKGGFSLAAANKQVEPLAMIETRQAFERLDDILSVPGIAGVFVGPNDLGISLGHAPTSSPKGAVLDVIKEIARRTREKGLVAGIFCVDVQTAREMQSFGYNFVSVATDSGLVLDAARRALSAAKM